MKQIIKRILSIGIVVLILLSLSACTDTPIEKPIDVYMVDGNTPVKDITPKFNYYTEGLTIRKIDSGWDFKKVDDDKSVKIEYVGAYIRNETVRKYVYLPSEVDGVPVVVSTYDSYRQSSQNEKVEYIFVGEGIYYVTLLVQESLGTNVILPESIITVCPSFGKTFANIFYMGSKEDFNCVRFTFMDGIWYGEDYCTDGINYLRFLIGEDADPIPVYYYSETEPDEKGVYWHYIDGLPVVWQ